MNDLINRLRNYAQWHGRKNEGKDHIAWEAADLLESQQAALRKCLDRFQYGGSANSRWYIKEQRP